MCQHLTNIGVAGAGLICENYFLMDEGEGRKDRKPHLTISIRHLR